VEEKIRVFDSFADADRAEVEYHMSLTPAQRIQLVIELRNQRHPDAFEQGLARVCRVVRLEESE
jgi:hypothetical protein